VAHVHLETLMKRAVLLTGATSQLGVFLLPRLVDAGMPVIAVSRQGKPAHWPVFDGVDWVSAAEARDSVAGCRYFISAGPLDVAQEMMTEPARFESAVVFSSSSVVTKQASNQPEERAQMQTMRALESSLREAAQRLGTRLTVFKPTMIYGCGMDSNISRLAAFVSRFGFMPVNGQAQGLRQPVHADDLAEVAVKALTSDKTLPPELFLPGGEALSYAEMVKRIFLAVDKPPRLVALPGWLFMFMIFTAARLNKGLHVNPEMARRQRTDLVFDSSPAQELLGYSPRGFQPTAKDFELPAIMAAKQ
jgi:nucleoside-diphosphate-sugar epimerase